MEEQADDRCNVVYFCASAGEDVTACHRPESLSELPAESSAVHSLQVIYQNVRALLDPDRGGFHEGQLSSRH